MTDETGAGGSAVRWNEWEPETLSRAAAEGKLIFLDIGATWCHWCHVLDRTSLADPRVARMLNEDFVSVRVDTDRRPDVNERYNQGGWPTVAVLLPDGNLLTGATYLPPDALAVLLEKCRDFYRRDRERIDAHLAQEAAQREDLAADRRSAPEAPRPEDLPLVKRAVLSTYDPEHPGFFLQPKFPLTDILSFLLDAWVAEGNREMGDTLLTVLRTMGGSGLFDPVEGGFFRYATQRDWTVPHYEKMLSDNAELLSLYSAAYERTKESSLAATGRDILRFLFAKLHDSATGAFFGSQDADESYYPLPAEERSRRFPPAVDRTIFSEYNGKMVSALVAAHRAFGAPPVPENGGSDVADDSLLARAERLARFLREALWKGEEGQARHLARPGIAEEPLSGLLSDHASVSSAYLDLFDATGKDEYLRYAEEALSFSIGRQFRTETAGFVDRRAAEGDFGHLAVELYPFGPNAQAATALLRCARATGRQDRFDVALRTLCGLSTECGKRGAFAASYGSALLAYWKGEPGKACIPGDPTCS